MDLFVKAAVALVLLAGAICGAAFFTSMAVTLSAYALLLTGMLFLAAKAVQAKSAKTAKPAMTRIPRQQRPPQRY